MEIFLSLDGVSEERVILTDTEVLKEGEWTHLLLSYEDQNGTLSLYSNGQLVSKSSNLYFSGFDLPPVFQSYTGRW